MLVFNDKGTSTNKVIYSLWSILFSVAIFTKDIHVEEFVNKLNGSDSILLSAVLNGNISDYSDLLQKYEKYPSIVTTNLLDKSITLCTVVW